MTKSELQKIMDDFEIPFEVACKIKTPRKTTISRKFDADNPLETRLMDAMMQQDSRWIKCGPAGSGDKDDYSSYFTIFREEDEKERKERIEAEIERIQFKLVKKALLYLAIFVEKVNQKFDDAFKMIGINRVTNEFRDELQKASIRAKDNATFECNSKPYGINHNVTFLTNENGNILDFKIEDSEEKDQQEP